MFPGIWHKHAKEAFKINVFPSGNLYGYFAAADEAVRADESMVYYKSSEEIEDEE